MNIIVCLDDNLGMAFNSRRQSMDRCVRKKIAQICKDKPLYMNTYSAKQFENENISVIADDNFLNIAKNDDFCFIETTEFPISSVDTLYAFMWNRVYPCDLHLGFDIDSLNLIETTEFQGNSHEKITLNVYNGRKIK